MDAEEDSRCGDSRHNLFYTCFCFSRNLILVLLPFVIWDPICTIPKSFMTFTGALKKLTILIHWSGRVAHLGRRLRTASYARKVRKLFQHMDDSGDGALNVEESLGAKRGQSPSTVPMGMVENVEIPSKWW